MKKILGLLLIVVMFLSIGATTASPIKDTTSGNSYYVSPIGNDTNPCTMALPCLTLQKVANMTVAGDTVYLRGGTYNQKMALTSSNSGTPEAYITYTAYPGETPVIDGTGISTPWAGLIQGSGVSYITIDGLTVINGTSRGIQFSSSSSNIVITNNHVTHIFSSGIATWSSSYVLIRGNVVSDARYPTGSGNESISISGTTNFDVSYNEVSVPIGATCQSGNIGIDVKDGSRFGVVHHNYIHDMLIRCGGIYIDAWEHLTGNIDIYSNYVTNVAWGITVGSERTGTAENIRIYNNLMYNVGSTGIGIGHMVATGMKRNIEIYNNTIYKATGNGGAGIYIVSPYIENITIRNNIVYFNNHNGEIAVYGAEILPHIKVNNNLVFGPKLCSLAYPNCVEVSNNPPGYPDIFGNITANPMFVSLSLPDLHLLLGSPAIDLGVSVDFVGVDYDNNIRPQGLGIDAGAYEYPVLETPTSTPTRTATPAYTSTKVATSTSTATKTPTSTPTRTSSPSPTRTSVSTSTSVPTSTKTSTPDVTPTPVPKNCKWWQFWCWKWRP